MSEPVLPITVQRDKKGSLFLIDREWPQETIVSKQLVLSADPEMSGFQFNRETKTLEFTFSNAQAVYELVSPDGDMWTFRFIEGHRD
jgi:hypothetical protein